MAGNTATSAVLAVSRKDDPAFSVLVIGSPAASAQTLTQALRGRNCRIVDVTERELIERLTTRKLRDAIVLIHAGLDRPVSDQTLSRLQRLHVPVMLLGDACDKIALPDWLWDAPGPGATPDEIYGRASTLVRMAQHARRMRSKLRKLKRVGRHLQYNYEQLDNELLLAGQLQRDFLPKQLPNVQDLSFVTLMRPFSWVSGDIYDIFRIDESHVGMYVADAVGHGVAAGLLTMFIKQALVAKRVTGNSYRVLTAAEVLHNLNQSMAMHNLPNCQYVTICYMVVNFKTRHVQVARAAHPAPLLIDPDGSIRPIESNPGCVIGVFPEQEFSQVEVDLQAGQKLVVFSDGLEEAFGRDDTQRNRWQRILRRNAGHDIHTVFRKLQKCIDRTSGSLHPEDDITAIGLEVAKDPVPPK